MPRFNANIQFMFTEYDVLDRYDAAAKAGFTGVELQSPYDIPIAEIVARLESNGLRHVLINLPGDDPSTGAKNVAINPARRDLFRESVDQGVEYAAGLDCVAVNSGVGPAIDGVSHEAHWETYVENMQYAAPLFAEVGVKLLIEPINTRDQPGFFIHDSSQGMAAVAAVGHPNFGLQYDVYHMQIMEGDLAPTIAEHLSSIGHIQIADTPGRHEPGTGEINYPFVFAHLDSLGYSGWVGAEYHPSKRTEDTLEWARPYLSGQGN
jgi:hydroxypyruvate isomerase